MSEVTCTKRLKIREQDTVRIERKGYSLLFRPVNTAGQKLRNGRRPMQYIGVSSPLRCISQLHLRPFNMNTLPSTFTWSVTVCGPASGGVLQRNLVKVASVIGCYGNTEGIMQDYSSRGSSYYNRNGSSGQLEFEMPDFSKHPHWEVSMDEMCAEWYSGGTAETETMRVAYTLKAEGDSDPLDDSNYDSNISFCDTEPIGCNQSINRSWMSWEPQSHPIVEFGFTDCYTGKELELPRVTVILRFRQRCY
jgi:hypothetical protein